MSNSVANPKTMEVFPDLHHKMSKKIAQLTKVIYHLNTKNEDHTLEMEVMSSNHQMEIQNILRDAANRINKFKEMVENRQQAVSSLFSTNLVRNYSSLRCTVISNYIA
ncbi:hypothetical protein EON65_20905 [archaeon]|nr:MAG: hypothetical protein EON65_20905 [archaeon]